VKIETGRLETKTIGLCTKTNRLEVKTLSTFWAPQSMQHRMVETLITEHSSLLNSDILPTCMERLTSILTLGIKKEHA